MPFMWRSQEAWDHYLTADLSFSVVVIREVPATVCSQCGAHWIQDDTAERIEAIVDEEKASSS